jgi:hypothetical protein
VRVSALPAGSVLELPSDAAHLEPGSIFWSKMGLFWLKTALFGVKYGQNQGFAVTDSSTEQKHKWLINK